MLEVRILNREVAQRRPIRAMGDICDFVVALVDQHPGKGVVLAPTSFRATGLTATLGFSGA